ncbi:beta-class carbonic anhydrase [Streptomyces montanisoli]|uniref:carbonic anhydrase n=1 Tax=Streptomyces montanisoli TaxID=2798581 RepID=A0A940S1L5_9ACTN|nr:carbonic anhydrase [Streptomyces montanisoli]MBP0462099.1 carbonic anhydrase [Streptomyces montanisoli]
MTTPTDSNKEPSAASHDGGTDRLVEANARYADSFEDPGLSARPSKRVAVVCCMDTRIDLANALGLKVGDHHTLRNAGGTVTDDVIRSLAVSQRALGTTSVVLVHHTRCGMTTITEGFRDEIEEEVGQRPTWPVEAFKSAEQDVRQSIRRVRTSPFLPHVDDVRGFVFDVETGRLAEVAAD